MQKINFSLIIISLLLLSNCATLTNDPMTPVAFSLSDGSKAKCIFTNKRGSWHHNIPNVVSVRRSDEDLRYECNTLDKRRTIGTVKSTMGAKIVASAVFLDFGIVDSITDKHREYPASFVIPIDPSEKL